MIKEIKLPCHAVILVKELRTKTQAETSNNLTWPPYADVIFETECVGLKDHGEDTEELEIDKVNIPIQLRSIDSLVKALLWLKEELLK